MNLRMREKNTFFPFISCFFYILHSFQLHRLTPSTRCYCSRLSSWWKCLLISSLHFNIFIHFAYKLFHARSLPSSSESLSWKCSKNETSLGSFPKHLSIWERVAWWSEFSPHSKGETLKRSILPARWACEEEIHKFTLMWLVAATQYNVCICSNANVDGILNSSKIGGYEIPIGARGWTDKYSNHSFGSYMRIMILINAQIDGNNWLEIWTQSEFPYILKTRKALTRKKKQEINCFSTFHNFPSNNAMINDAVVWIAQCWSDWEFLCWTHEHTHNVDTRCYKNLSTYSSSAKEKDSWYL